MLSQIRSRLVHEVSQWDPSGLNNSLFSSSFLSFWGAVSCFLLRLASSSFQFECLAHFPKDEWRQSLAGSELITAKAASLAWLCRGRSATLCLAKWYFISVLTGWWGGADNHNSPTEWIILLQLTSRQSRWLSHCDDGMGTQRKFHVNVTLSWVFCSKADKRGLNWTSGSCFPSTRIQTFLTPIECKLSPPSSKYRYVYAA